MGTYSQFTGFFDAGKPTDGHGRLERQKNALADLVLSFLRPWSKLFLIHFAQIQTPPNTDR